MGEKEVKIKVSADVDDEQVKALEELIDSLAENVVGFEVDVEDGEIDAAKEKEESLNDTALVDVDVDTSELEAAGVAIGNLSDGASKTKAAIGDLAGAIDEVQQAGMQSEQNKAFLEMNLGADKAKQTYQDISDIVASMPGDDNTMRSVLSTAQALGNDLKPEEMRAATETMADYMSGSATMGKMATESQQDIMKYLLDGNTAELEKGSIVSSQVDKLKDATTFMERQQAMQEVLNDLGYGGIANQDTMLNKQAEWEGMMYNSQDTLSSMWLGAEKGAMDYIIKLNDANHGIVGIGIAAGSVAGGPLVDAVTGLGQMAVGMKAIKDLGMIQYIKNLEIMTKLSAAADWLLSGAQTVLNAVMSMNPIVLVVIALIALAAALIWAYQNVDWFREMVDNAWASLQQFGQQLVTNVQNAINQFSNAVQGIPKALKQCLEWAYNIVMNHPLVKALAWLGDQAASAFSKVGLGQNSPGKIVQSMEQELDWTSDAIKGSKLAKDTASLGSNMSNSFNPSISDVSSAGGGIVLNVEVGSVDSSDRVQEIVDAIRRELAWNNATAGRTV